MATTEKIEFDTAAFEHEYGHRPRGRGGWYFYFDEGNNAPSERAWFAEGAPAFADAKKKAMQRAREIGAHLVTVAT